jgi:hypothetical protein
MLTPHPPPPHLVLYLAYFPQSQSLCSRIRALTSHLVLVVLKPIKIDNVLVVEYGSFDPTPAWFEPPDSPPTAPIFNYTIPVPSLNGKTVSLNIGKTVGGSSAVNGQVFDRGSRWNYQEWARLNEGEENAQNWGWDGIIPFFKKVSPMPMPSPGQ